MASPPRVRRRRLLRPGLTAVGRGNDGGTSLVGVAHRPAPLGIEERDVEPVPVCGLLRPGGSAVAGGEDGAAPLAAGEDGSGRSPRSPQSLPIAQPWEVSTKVRESKPLFVARALHVAPPSLVAKTPGWLPARPATKPWVWSTNDTSIDLLDAGHDPFAPGGTPVGGEEEGRRRPPRICPDTTQPCAASAKSNADE